MAYEKRVCVLRQIKRGFSANGGTLSGAVYAERLGEELTITPRILGLAPLKEGRYALALSVGGKDLFFEWKGGESLRAEKAPSLAGGFSVLVLYARGEAEPVAYGSCGANAKSAEELLKAFSPAPEAKKKRAANPLPPIELPTPMPNVPLAPTVPLPGAEPQREDGEESAPFRYDDEAIASVDYFGAADEDGNPSAGGGEKGGKKDCGKDSYENADDTFLPTRGKLTYYNAVREKLEEAFKKFPPDDRLKEVFSQSEWVKGEGALIGIIYENGIPRYLCVAAEGEGKPPEEMKDHAVFVPESPFTEERGFFVVFQDADTGEYVHISAS